MSTEPIISLVQDEQAQGPKTRHRLFLAVEKDLGRSLLIYCTSFRYPVGISQPDVDILESVLQSMDLTKGLAVMLSSPGGDGIAAERIIGLFRQYSGTDEYWAIVPSRAKSAATMISLGASKIMMGPSSELGPIDPQLVIRDGKTEKAYSVWNIVESYRKLFQGATKTKGNVEPFLQQLENYNYQDIAHYEQLIGLTEDIAIKTLHTGMLSAFSEKEVKDKMAMFLDPKHTKSHSRPIYAPEAKVCGLTIEVFGAKTKKWNNVYELYLRAHNLTQSRTAKLIETTQTSFAGRIAGKLEEDA